MPRSSFYHLCLKSETSQGSSNTHSNSPGGWKFHVSIDDFNQANLARGWDIVKEVLITHRVYHFKVVKHRIQMHEIPADGSQRGKQITIYACEQSDEPLSYWQGIIFEITRQLAAENILPSYRPSSDRAVPGSNYVSYRNEKDPRDEGFNPEDSPDPFEDLKIEGIVDQPPIPDWGSPAPRDNNSLRTGCCGLS